MTQPIQIVLETINHILSTHGNWDISKWTAEKIYSKDLVAILRLLVALARHYKAPIRMPEGVCISVLLVRKLNGQLHHWRQNEVITDSSFQLLNGRCEDFLMVTMGIYAARSLIWLLWRVIVGYGTFFAGLSIYIIDVMNQNNLCLDEI